MADKLVQVQFKAILLSVATLFISVPGFADELAVSAESAVVMDAQSGKVLWAKDQDTPRFPASTSKIMTALLLIERCRPEEMITAPDDVENVKEASLHLKPGEQLSAQDMLYAILLRSANDACYCVAKHIGGSVDGFSKLMNERAAQIGCKHTHFHNPNGLNDPLHTISALDLAMIAREAMKREEFRSVVRLQKHTIKRSINQEDTIMASKNKWLAKDVTADGIKTGYTIPAGKCYVGSATRNGYRVITVILKSKDWQADHQGMLDWAFKSHEQVTIAEASTPLWSRELAGGAAPVDVGLLERLSSAVRRLITVERSEPVARLELDEHLEVPIKRGQPIGWAVMRDRDGYEFRVRAIALNDVERARLMGGISGAGSPTILFAVALAGRAYMAKRRSRRFFESV